MENLKTGPLARKLIMHFESLHDGDLSRIGLQPKMDPVGIWTVGYGHALTNVKTGSFLRGEKDKVAAYSMFPDLTNKEAEDLMAIDLRLTYEGATKKMLSMNTLSKISDEQFGALVSFCYNCGTHYKNKLGIKYPYAIWANVDKFFNRTLSAVALKDYWKKSVITSGGKVLEGLKRRRASEAILFVDGVLNTNPSY